ncbi:alpha/beta hydrolase [Spirosoma areae]
MHTLYLPSLFMAILGCVANVNAQPMAAHSAQRYLNPVFPNIIKTPNLAFGQSVNDQGRLQRHLLDIYQPARDTVAARPVIVLLHGGGFVNGDKANMTDYAREFARRGYVAVSINYRLATKPLKTNPPDANFLAAVDNAKEDAFGAIRWLRANAAKYRLDKGRIALMGYSAGAITALAVNFDQGTQRQENDGGRGQSTAISTIVEISGGIDTTMIKGNEKPVLIIHGTKDKGVKYGYALAINKACKEKGIPVLLQPVLDGTHDIRPVFSQIASGTPQWFRVFLVDAKPAY